LRRDHPGVAACGQIGQADGRLEGTERPDFDGPDAPGEPRRGRGQKAHARGGVEPPQGGDETAVGKSVSRYGQPAFSFASIRFHQPPMTFCAGPRIRPDGTSLSRPPSSVMSAVQWTRVPPPVAVKASVASTVLELPMPLLWTSTRAKVGGTG